MSNIKLSVIVPVYNVEKYLSECLKSLINQTLDSIEIILVDDGSTDGSKKICEEYSKRYEYIKLISQYNSGPGTARNNGIIHAQGKYIGFVDSDDYIHKDMYNKMLNIAERDDLDLVTCAVEMYFNDTNKRKVIENNNIKDEIITSDLLIEKIFNKSIQCFSCNKIYKKELFNGIKYDEGVYYEDIYTMFKIALKSKRIKLLNDSFYFYRQRDNNITSNISLKHIIDFNLAIQKVNKDYIKIKNNDNELLTAFNINYFLTSIDLYIKNKKFNMRTIYEEFSKYYVNYKTDNFRKVIFNKFINLKSKILYTLWILKLLPLMKYIKINSSIIIKNLYVKKY